MFETASIMAGRTGSALGGAGAGWLLERRRRDRRPRLRRRSRGRAGRRLRRTGRGCPGRGRREHRGHQPRVQPHTAHPQGALVRHRDRRRWDARTIRTTLSDAEFPNTSPPLDWAGLPEGTVSIALIMESNQVPGEAWSHWVIWNIPPDAVGLPEAVATTTDVVAIGPKTRQGVNDDKTTGYFGPCPAPVKVIDNQIEERAGRAGLRVLLPRLRA